MRVKRHRPSWWLLYLSLPAFLGLYLVEMRLPLSEGGRRLAELFILLIVYGGIFLWQNANRGAILEEDRLEQQAEQSRYLRQISLPRPAPPEGGKNLPASGVASRWHIKKPAFARLAGRISSIVGSFHL